VSRARRTPRREAGFTYVGLIVLVTIIGLVGAATLKADALLRRAAAEEELLEIGAAFSAALKSYAEATPRGQPNYPPTLQELLKDPRFPGVRRHLRRIFVDPVTGKAEWGIVHAAEQKGVLAVYSLSQARPLKVANFDARFPNFENKEHISEWKFAAVGQAIGQPGQNRAQGVPEKPAPSLFPPAQPAPELPAPPPPPPTAPPPSEPPLDPPAGPPSVAPPAEEAGDGKEKGEEKDEEKADGKEADSETPRPADQR
jgi:type II secretory pathway pseudopilin PulG